MIFDSIAKALKTAGQLPLDAKTYFLSLDQMRDLGLADANAYTYYEYMKVLCVENGNYYIWQEVDPLDTNGVLEQNFQYGQNVLSNNIDYSGRYFNFVVETAQNLSNAIGKPYIIYKDWTVNKADFLEINDVVDGHFSSTLFLRGARYKGGPVNLITSWAVQSDFNPKELV